MVPINVKKFYKIKLKQFYKKFQLQIIIIYDFIDFYKSISKMLSTQILINDLLLLIICHGKNKTTTSNLECFHFNALSSFPFCSLLTHLKIIGVADKMQNCYKPKWEAREEPKCCLPRTGTDQETKT